MNVFGDIKLKPLKTIPLDFKAPFELFKKIYSNYSSTFLLESMESDSGLSRYSFLGFNPALTLTAKDEVLQIEKEGSVDEIDTKNPFNEIKSLINAGNGKKGFCGGLVGYASYQSARYFEPSLNIKSGNFPDFEFGLFLDGIIFDRLSSRCQYVTLGENRLEEIKNLAKEDYFVEDKMKVTENGRYFTKDQYEKMVTETKERIKNGEIFQGVISNAQKYKITGNKLCFYDTLRKMNPSPYMYHLKLQEREIIGSSPEMLVRVENREVETFPIAGTRPRGANNFQDQKLAKELLADEKERAEHLMLVDLARNDVGKVSEFGSVRVPEYMTIKKFSHVQHILSRVTGNLQKDKTAVDAFSAIFPAGTVSGAPKIRAMDIIEEMERKSRDAYAGALGYFSLNGNANFAITIRTLVCQGDDAKIQAGAGIVHDSVPENEFLECENKAKALVKSLEMSGGLK
ncbi:anthranilate synthase component I [Methanobacterium alcaliphilum]|uniref:anthranilate synthase component I n=1 Tax=Methanobacterium alcaliphilum TaxID=392018 RepID=UPI00200AEFEF|nr:anthranilate synthase component I [Methanobacterium alcaliphilum]